MNVWTRVNQNLIAKAIGELVFEEVLRPLKKDAWELRLESGVIYEFDGWMTIWNHLRVDPSSIRRNGTCATSAAQFFIDTKLETTMDDITLGNFLEELHNTLSRDVSLFSSDISSNLAKLDDLSLQRILNGHPKILLNKGRMGWGQEASNRYSPEAGKAFQLRWVALKKEFAEGELKLPQDIQDDFKEIDPSFTLIPVHPWQWDRFIQIQFAEYLATGTMRDLGERGDFYAPQISLRTLSNVTSPSKMDVKLPLSILNTSCVRGLTQKTLRLGSEVSSILAKICKEDKLLKDEGCDVLKESGGVTVPHPYYDQVEGAPYRYHEFLGALYRESTASKLAPREKAILTSVLHHQDQNKRTVLEEYIKLSGLSPKNWLTLYFRKVIVPLYHLQLEYGVGMVAHGQNIVLKLKDYVPSGMLLKDFQGDFRLSSKLPEKGQKYFGHLAAEITRLPPEYLIHDLITGHFITVLRFISGALEETEVMTEQEFYALLGEEIRAYGLSRTIPSEQNLLAPRFKKLLLNKVRFTIGYGDSSERPLPILGEDIINPLLSKWENRS